MTPWACLQDDQPVTATSPRRDEQRGRALGPAAGEPRWALGALVFVKQDAPLPAGSLAVVRKGWTNPPGCPEQRF